MTPLPPKPFKGTPLSSDIWEALRSCFDLTRTRGIEPMACSLFSCPLAAYLASLRLPITASGGCKVLEEYFKSRSFIHRNTGLSPNGSVSSARCPNHTGIYGMTETRDDFDVILIHLKDSCVSPRANQGSIKLPFLLKHEPEEHANQPLQRL